MIRVFRVEHRKTRIGPFHTPDPYLQELACRASKIADLPSPHDDGLGLASIPWTFVFGSPSLDTLKRWVLLDDAFDNNKAIVRELIMRDFVLVEYSVEEGNYRSGISGLQVAFDARTCRQKGLDRYHEMRVLLAQ